MLRQAREVGPTVLIPLAWAFVGAAHLDIVADRTLFIAHVVMTVLLAVFAVTGRADMREGVLHTWWVVIAVGFVATLVGAVGFHLAELGPTLQGVALFGWMLLPAVGFVDTGRRASERSWLYLGAAGSCVLGAVLYGVGIPTASVGLQVGGIAVVGLGQTVGILDAAFRY